MLQRCLIYPSSIMQTHIPVKNCGYIAMSFHTVINCRLCAYIQYIEHGFIGFLTHAAFRVIMYSKYFCLVILIVHGLGLSGYY